MIRLYGVLYQGPRYLPYLASGGPTSADVWNTYCGIASVHKQQGNYELALENYNKSLPIQILLGANHPRVGDTYYNMVGLYEMQAEYDLAMGY
jgi:hypothetical protein